MRYQKTKVQIKKNDEIIPNPCHPNPHPDMNEPPLTYPIPPSFIGAIQWTQNSWYK